MQVTNKKGLLWISIIMTLLSIFFVSYGTNKFGAPFQFISYIGENELPSVFSLFTKNGITSIQFNIFYFFIDVTLIYFILFYGRKIISLLKISKQS
ncbi:hypothetical protein D0439_12540 [Lysinibacillus fusiformis]|uniref:hypothetical protein n=1 Tax=Lysinibacillus fusiformis TaxID=28031 RepID=UPI0011BBD534|nr:hypothetical protein [Lysinibacillus fusiformis]QDZ99402.1 hypothetical protein D0439_12540 [Lysinibacillus fusiformis]UXJ70861.1 hypothetical protein N5069_10080 [Lysinibacillus fusiformis]